uniref:Uncharacterized protein n=1 Tax=mine drainage metagenome TaxID=410659 RepID=E6Q0A9_9ZZZZ
MQSEEAFISPTGRVIFFYKAMKRERLILFPSDVASVPRKIKGLNSGYSQ